MKEKKMTLAGRVKQKLPQDEPKHRPKAGGKQLTPPGSKKQPGIMKSKEKSMGRMKTDR